MSGRRVASIAALGLMVVGCGRIAPTQATGSSGVSMHVRFADGRAAVISGIPAGIDSMQFDFYATTGGSERLISSDGFAVGPNTPEIHLDFKVPLGTSYRVTGVALGQRDRESPSSSPLPTLPGTQFYSSKSLDAGLGPAVPIDLTLVDVVPTDCFIAVNDGAGDSLSWSPVPFADHYRVRVFHGAGLPVDFITPETSYFVPLAQTGFPYRVSAELRGGEVSAFSEIFEFAPAAPFARRVR